MNKDNFKDLLHSKWGDKALAGEKLRGAFADNWIRFYSLPNAKRYPENDSEYQVLLNRLNTIISELNPTKIAVLMSIWNAEIQNEIEYGGLKYKYFSTADDGTSVTPRRIYISILDWRAGIIDNLLRDIASNKTSGVVLAPENLSWLSHPYDGGIDVIIANEEESKRLKQRYEGWIAEVSS